MQAILFQLAVHISNSRYLQKDYFDLFVCSLHLKSDFNALPSTRENAEMFVLKREKKHKKKRKERKKTKDTHRHGKKKLNVHKK